MNDDPSVIVQTRDAPQNPLLLATPFLALFTATKNALPSLRGCGGADWSPTRTGLEQLRKTKSASLCDGKLSAKLVCSTCPQFRHIPVLSPPLLQLELCSSEKLGALKTPA